MLLMHAAGLNNLRAELIHSVGVAHTRRVFMRAGFASGVRDAALAKQVRPKHSLYDAFAVGPQLHMLQGAVQVSPLTFELDLEAHHYLGIYRWDHSWEADAHVRELGQHNAPVCWMLLGYASGYTSSFFNRPVFYKEQQCAGCGDSHCLIEGRFQDEWPDHEALSADYAVDSILEKIHALRDEVASLRTQIDAVDDAGPLVGQSAAFLAALDLVKHAAPTRVAVLLSGETGVGKERFAKTLHQMSQRADGPFVAVNCAALPADLIESELFGVEKGAFTGANVARAGRFERAHGGTLLLDEMGELPLALQAKLLRVLQTGEVERLGSTKTLQLDVRIVAATHVDLEAAVLAGTFRRDLLYRLNVFPICVPPLRERIDDIAPLANHLLEQFKTVHGKRILGFADRAIDAMMNYHWPGNVRELENVIERGVILTKDGQPIEVKNLFPSLPAERTSTLGTDGSLQTPMGAFVEQCLGATNAEQAISLPDLERTLLREAVRLSNGNLSAAARMLGLTRPQLAYRLQRDQGYENHEEGTQ